MVIRYFIVKTRCKRGALMSNNDTFLTFLELLGVLY